MVYCCVGGCSNLHGRKDQKSKVRHFLRFYTIPKDLPLRNKWEARLYRRKNIYHRIYVCVFGLLPWFRLWAKPPSEVTDKLYPEDADTPEERERPKHWSWDGVLVYPGGQQCGESNVPTVLMRTTWAAVSSTTVLPGSVLSHSPEQSSSQRVSVVQGGRWWLQGAI